MPWSVAAAAIGAGGAIMSSKNNQKAAEAGSTSRQSLDPRMEAYLYGDTSGGGLLDSFRGLINTQQSLPSQVIGGLAGGYLQSGDGAGADIGTIRSAANSLIGGNAAPHYETPGVSNPLWMDGARIDAPAQNNVDTATALKGFIYGDEGSNPYLTRALQAGVNQTNAAFQSNQNSLTDTLQRQVLPGIDSTAIASGGFGGSRHGVAQGNAISDYTKQLTNTNLQLGLANSANTTGAQADAFNQGRNRALSATQGLSAQQYGVASQHAAMDQQARLANQGVNTQYTLANQGAQLSTNALNANSKLTTNAQNSQGRATGVGLLSGTLGQLYGYSQNNDNFAFDRARQVSNLMTPYTGLNSSTTSTQPYYGSTAGSAIGGALGGLSLYNQFNQSGGAGGSSGYNAQDLRNIWG